MGSRGDPLEATLDRAMARVHVCPKCQSRVIVRVERGDMLERLKLKMVRKLPYRCLDCDHRFFDRPLSRQP